MSLTICTVCHRHHRLSEQACPFCAAQFPGFGAQSATSLAVAAALLVACGGPASAPAPGTPPPEYEAPRTAPSVQVTVTERPAAIYGGPPVPAEVPSAVPTVPTPSPSVVVTSRPAAIYGGPPVPAVPSATPAPAPSGTNRSSTIYGAPPVPEPKKR